MSNNPQRDEIIRRMDLLAEFQKYGGRVPPNAQVSLTAGSRYIPSTGKMSTLQPPSTSATTPANGEFTLTTPPPAKGSMSIFDVLIRLPLSPWMMGKRPITITPRRQGWTTGGAEQTKREKIAPTMGDVEGFQKNFAPETKDFLRDKRGLTEDSLTKYRVGWCLKRQRNAFPVFDENGNLVNIRFHNSKKEPKTLNWFGYGSARLWGLDRLAKAAPGITVLLTEGEFDAMLAEQETGFLAVSGTNGAKSFQAGLG